MPFPIILEIIPSGNNGWDVSKAKRIKFNNQLKAFYFCRYYTRKNDCLVRYYCGGIWRATYCKGKLIWDLFS